MKRFAALFMILALVFTVLPVGTAAFATENDGEVKVQKADLELKAKTVVKGKNVKVSAKILNKLDKLAKLDGVVNGTLTYSIKGKNKSEEKKVNNLTDEVTFENLAPGKYTVKVVFKGKIGNLVNVKLEGNTRCELGEGETGEEPAPAPAPEPTEPCADPKEAEYKDIAVETSKANGKLKVQATMPGKEVEGNWYLGLAPIDSEEPPAELGTPKFEGHKGNTITYEYDVSKLEEDVYLVFVGFEGKADGKNCVFGAGGEAFKWDGDTVTPDPDPIVSPGKGKEVVDKLKGGKLPQTATNYPITAAAGAVVLLAGAALLAFRRTV